MTTSYDTGSQAPNREDEPALLSDLWLTLHAHLHVLEMTAATEAEQVAVPHLALSRIELTDNGVHQPVTGERVVAGYRDIHVRVAETEIGFTDRVRVVVDGLRQLEKVAPTLADTLCVGRAGIHAIDALERLTAAEPAPW